jgi:hypothetical protein
MQFVELDITDHVALVTMNAPPVNAVSAHADGRNDRHLRQA